MHLVTFLPQVTLDTTPYHRSFQNVSTYLCRAYEWLLLLLRGRNIFVGVAVLRNRHQLMPVAHFFRYAGATFWSRLPFRATGNRHQTRVAQNGKSAQLAFQVLRILQLIFKDVSREFDEFQVNTHLCKLRCWHL